VPAPSSWPGSVDELIAAQTALAAAQPARWRPADPTLVSVGACFVCFERGGRGPGDAGDRGWAAAVWSSADGRTDVVTAEGRAAAPYTAGLLALREAPLLARALDGLPHLSDVLLVDATGRDHPRRAGMALHLGAALDLPTVGVTNRLLVARGDPPGEDRFARSALVLAGETVGYWVRTRPGRHPVAVHAAWRTDADTAAAVVTACVGRFRTPEPLRRARRAARLARAEAGPDLSPPPPEAPRLVPRSAPR
jgi:deoxyribonuclease V